MSKSAIYVIFTSGDMPTCFETKHRYAKTSAESWGGYFKKYIPAPAPQKLAKAAPVAKSQEMTDWIPCKTPPVRVGVYERNDPRWYTKFFQKWNGEKWLSFCNSPGQASRQIDVSDFQGGCYRGFTTPQE